MKLTQRPGFTLIELLVVIVLGAILFSAGLIAFRDFSPQASLSVEKQTVGSILAGITFYHHETESFPAQLDGAAIGSTASSANPFFGQVLAEPVQRDWRKTGTNTWEAPSGKCYSYDRSCGVFQQVSAEADPPATTTTAAPGTTTTSVTTTTTPGSTTTTVTTTTTASTSTTIPGPPPSVTTVNATFGSKWPTWQDMYLHLAYDFGGAGSGSVGFDWKLSGAGTWTVGVYSPKSGSGTFYDSLTAQLDSTYDYRAKLQYGTTEIYGDVLNFVTPP